MLKYSAAGNFIDKWTSTDNLGGSLFFYGIATDAVGDIYVVAGGNLGEKILKFHEVPFAAEAGNNNKFKKIKVIVRCPLTDCIADLNGKARIPIRNPGPKRGLATAAKSKAFKVKKKRVELSAGNFAENITTRGILVGELPVGTRIYIDDAILEITQIGKECHHGCAIFKAVGDCVMPRKGVFAKVVCGGTISTRSTCSYESK